MTTKTTYKVGDKVRILNKDGIYAGDDLTNGKVYEVVMSTDSDGDICIKDDGHYNLLITADELKYIEKVAEQVAKFKVGDKVKLLSGGGAFPLRGATNGKVYEIAEIRVSGRPGEYRFINDNGNNAYANSCNIELAPQKPTKNQRITTLEQTVADLQAEVAALKAAQKLPTMTVKADVDVTKIAESLAKAIEKHSPNERRKEIIAGAKAFVEENVSKNHPKLITQGLRHGAWFTSNAGTTKTIYADFVVNVKKRTVVALICNIDGSEVRSKAIAKCAPDDVFNADIGKAIALGRALGLDVERFEKAVQPTEFAVGQVTHTTRGSFVGTPLKITKIDGDMAYTNPGRFHFFDEIDIVNIVDDTEAQY